jgi:hypothetical protein
MKNSIWTVIIGLSLALYGCGKEKTTLDEQPTIAEIVTEPALYEGKTVIIDGKFGGWSHVPQCDDAHIVIRMRSDVMIYDETGCLYMTGDYEVLYNEKELNPWDKDNIGADLRIKALVSLIEGKPILGEF